MFVRKYGDLITGIFFLLLSAFYFSQIGTIQIIDSGSLDAAFVPKIVAGAMFILSICMIVMSSIKIKREVAVFSDQEAETTPNTSWKSIIMTAVLLVVYVALFQKVGFLITTAIYLFLQLLILAPERKPKQIILFAVSSVIGAIVLQYIFVHLLYVMLPEGILR